MEHKTKLESVNIKVSWKSGESEDITFRRLPSLKRIEKDIGILGKMVKQEFDYGQFIK